MTAQHEETQMSAEKPWIEWNGGECPVEPDLLIEAETGDGARYEGIAGAFMRGRWEHSKHLRSSGDWIVAYRLAQASQ